MAIDEYMTDGELEEKVRAWWRDNWAWLLSGIVLGVAILVGWYAWRANQAESGAAAGEVFRELVAASGRNDFGAMERLHDQLRADYARTPYAEQGSLVLARMYVETGEFDKAVTLLTTVKDEARDEDLGAVARLRLARVLIQQDKPDEALALADVPAESAFSALAYEVRGDALYAKGDIEGARGAYASALTATGPDGAAASDRELLRLKLQDLDAAGPAPAGSAPPAEPTP